MRFIEFKLISLIFLFHFSSLAIGNDICHRVPEAAANEFIDRISAFTSEIVTKLGLIAEGSGPQSIFMSDGREALSITRQPQDNRIRLEIRIHPDAIGLLDGLTRALTSFAKEKQQPVDVVLTHRFLLESSDRRKLVEMGFDESVGSELIHRFKQVGFLSSVAALDVLMLSKWIEWIDRVFFLESATHILAAHILGYSSFSAFNYWAYYKFLYSTRLNRRQYLLTIDPSSQSDAFGNYSQNPYASSR